MDNTLTFPAITSQAEFEDILLNGGEGGSLTPLQAAQLDFFLNGNPITSGTNQDDLLTGTDTDENIAGFDGNDTLLGNGGDDGLYGAEGDDEIRGGAGNDRIIPGSGEDTVFGDGGDDFIARSSGTEDGNTLAFGGDGNDVIESDLGNDELNGEAGNDFLLSGVGNDLVTGGEGNDTVTGEENNDTLSGNNGDDLLSGEEGKDILNGGDGNDTLIGTGDVSVNIISVIPPQSEGITIEPTGDTSIDTLTGEGGADTFVLGSQQGVLYANAGDDDAAVVTDFNSTEDKIQLSGAAEDYVLSSTYQGTSIYLDQDNNGLFSDGDEQIALIQGNSSLDLNSVDFDFV